MANEGARPPEVQKRAAAAAERMFEIVHTPPEEEGEDPASCDRAIERARSGFGTNESALLAVCMRSRALRAPCNQRVPVIDAHSNIHPILSAFSLPAPWLRLSTMTPTQEEEPCSVATRSPCRCC